MSTQVTCTCTILVIVTTLDYVLESFHGTCIVAGTCTCVCILLLIVIATWSCTCTCLCFVFHSFPTHAHTCNLSFSFLPLPLIYGDCGSINVIILLMNKEFIFILPIQQ